jgi:hypothetical protein
MAGYAPGVGPELERTVAEAQATLDAMTAQDCIECAALTRSVKPMLRADRTRAIAEREARHFEELAAEKRAASH